MRRSLRTTVALTAVLALFGTACSNDRGATASEAEGGSTASEGAEPVGGTETDGAAASGASEGDIDYASLQGTVAIDGSSTVGPLTDAVAEEFAQVAPDVSVNVGISGTGGGFERFCGEGSTDISNASRPISEEEVQLCEENGIEFTEIRVGTDALTMVTSPQTEGIDCLTSDEVIAVFGPDGVSTWSEVNPEFPDEPIEIFAPGTDSGTYDFMVEDIMGTEAARQDYNASEDDNIIAQGVIGTPYSWGFFGFAYYVNNQDQLKAIEYDAGEGCVAPSIEAAQDDSYKLARPLFIYVNNSSVQEEEHVAGFVDYYVQNVNQLTESVGYVPLAEDTLQETQQTVADLIGG